MAFTFTDRHIGPREKDIQKMLEVLNVSSLDELTKQVVPSDILPETGAFRRHTPGHR